MWLSDSDVLVIAFAVQVIGVFSVALARVSERSVAQAFCQCIFFASLLGVGVIGVLAITSGIRCWLIFATTLPLMALGATLDLRRSPGYSTF